MATFNRRTASELSTAATVIDAVLEFLRGRRKSGTLLLGAAALSRKVPGLGTAASVLLRVYRRLR
ncbi:hypothetical protein ACKVMT_11445 [Halobacteriales archaeon Cl-PHB]